MTLKIDSSTLRECLEKKTKEEMKNIAREFNFSGFSYKTKADLIPFIENNMKSLDFKTKLENKIYDSLEIFLKIIFAEKNQEIEESKLKEQFKQHRSLSTYYKTYRRLWDWGLISEYKRETKEWEFIIYVPKDLIDNLKEFMPKEVSIKEKAKTFSDEDTLFLKSKVKDYIKSKGFNSSRNVTEGVKLNRIIQALLDQAINQAKRNNRDIIYSEDLIEIAQPKNRIEMSEQWFYAGKKYIEDNKLIKAIFSFQMAKEFNDKNRLIFEELGKCYIKTERYKKALKIYEELKKFDPKNIDTRITIAEIYKAMDKGKKALESYEEAIKIDPNNQKLLTKAGEAREDIGHNRIALKYYEKAKNLNPDTFTHWFSLGQAYYYNDQYEKSIDSYNKALEMGDDILSEQDIVIDDIWVNLGLSYSIQENLNKALESFEEALKLNSENFEAYLNMGDIYKEKEDYDKALEFYKRALSIEPDDLRSLFSLGNFYLNQKDYQNAIEMFEKVIKIFPEYSMLRNLGDAYYYNKNYEKAIEIYEDILNLVPEDFDISYTLAICLKNLKKYDRAILFLEKLLDSDFEEYYYYDIKELQILNLLGNLYNLINKSQKAEKIYKKIREIDPKWLIIKEIPEKEEEKIVEKIIEDEEIKETEYIKEILEFEYIRQRKANKGDLLRKLNLSYSDCNKYFELLNEKIDYTEQEEQELENDAKKVFEKFKNPTLYHLINQMGYKHRHAKKLGSFFMKNQWVSQFNHFPKRKEEEAKRKKKGDINIYMSYSTIDAPLFKIRELSENLNEKEEIRESLYWEEDVKEDIIDYMDKNLEKCDIMLLFCTKNSKNSQPVKNEWSSFLYSGKPIIPIYINFEFVPFILQSKKGIKFDPFNFNQTAQEIYDHVLKVL